jgi:tight adherence protein C
MSAFIDVFYNPQMLVMILVAVAVFATIITFTLPLLATNKLETRMKYVSTERAAMRAQARERLLAESKQGRNLRNTPKSFMQNVVKQFKLEKVLGAEENKDKLRMAGLRGQAPMVTFLFFRFVMPFILMIAAFIYLNVVNDFDLKPMMRVVASLGAGFVGFYAPNMFVANLISRRQQVIKRAFPDTLDLMLICVEAGMSIEAAFNRVSKEIAASSIEMAEELSLTTAELSYLRERREAYENLAKRTGLPGVKAVSTSLIQAERYGTPIGNALRVLAQENRDMRMAEAERKAAGLPPKLTVPMIVFFLPVLFVVILGPAAMKVMAM